MTKTSLLATVGLALAAPSFAGSKEAPEATALRPLPSRLWGVTLDNVANAKLPKILTSLKSLHKMPIVRIVFDEQTSPSDYTQAVGQINPVSYIMGEILDSEYVNTYSLSAFTQRAQQFIQAFPAQVDLWEIMNESNGEWLGTTASVIAKMNASYAAAKAANVRTALTLYYNKDCWASADHEMFAWAQANVPANIKQGVDYVLISYYEKDCNNLKPNWPQVFAQLSQMFPNSKVGMGETGTTGSVATKTPYLTRYYTMNIPVANYVGGYFWWYGAEDAVPVTKPLWSVLNAAIMTMDP